MPSDGRGARNDPEHKAALLPSNHHDDDDDASDDDDDGDDDVDDEESVDMIRHACTIFVAFTNVSHPCSGHKGFLHSLHSLKFVAMP